MAETSGGIVQLLLSPLQVPSLAVHFDRLVAFIPEIALHELELILEHRGHPAVGVTPLSGSRDHEILIGLWRRAHEPLNRNSRTYAIMRTNRKRSARAWKDIALSAAFVRRLTGSLAKYFQSFSQVISGNATDKRPTLPVTQTTCAEAENVTDDSGPTVLGGTIHPARAAVPQPC